MFRILRSLSLVACALVFMLTLPAHATAKTDCSAFAAGTVPKGGSLMIDSQHLPPDTSTNLASVTVCGMNIYRYATLLQQQSKISNPPAIPGGIAAPAAGGAAAAPLVISGGGAPQYKPLSQMAGAKPEDMAAQLLTNLNYLQLSSAAENGLFLTHQLAATNANDCYENLAKKYPGVLLSASDEANLIQELTNGCPQIPPAWSNNDTIRINTLVAQAIQLNADVASFTGSADYATYLKNDAANADAHKQLIAGITTGTGTEIANLQKLLDPTAISSYNESVSTDLNWKGRATYALDPADHWDQTMALTCHVMWFGKTETLTVNLVYTDYTQATPTPSSTPAFSFTNACLPHMAVSSGLGISTVRNSTYAFVPKTDYTQNPPVTTQVIGYATDARITPFYVGQLNYAYSSAKYSTQLYVSGGAGLSSTAAGTAGDLFVGNAFSFFRRAIFITPSVHFTQRQQLMSGYAVGNPQAGLPTVPTINGWKTGFAVTITFPILQ